jgi:hypothetical protein
MTTPESPADQPYNQGQPAAGQPYYAGPPPAGQPYPQPSYPPPYGYPPPYPYPYPPAPTTNGMAIASMVLGILWIYWIGSILALVFGYVARDQIKKNGQSGDGMAIAGIVLGWVGVGILIATLVIAGSVAWSWW